MAINQTDIKLMASQELTDQPDAGGRMTGNEIPDGAVNNLFPDISRLDRVYGRVSMRKGFVFVDTEDNATYYGAHAILTDPPDDPLVHTTMFSQGSPTDLREDARDRVEEYVVKAAGAPFYLLGLHPEGSRSLTCWQGVGWPQPRVGEVLVLEDDTNSQYCRITSLESEQREYADASGTYTRTVLTIGIGDPLRFDFMGTDGVPRRTSSVDVDCSINETVVADSATYCGVKTLALPASSGDLTIKADSIWSHLVPSAQAETALTDRDAGTTTNPAIPAGNAEVSETAGVTMENGLILYPGPMVPGSLTITSGDYTWTDDGHDLKRGSTIEGRVDHGQGEVEFLDTALSGEMTLTITFTPAGSPVKTGNTASNYVELANRAYTWTRQLLPLPQPGTVIVDYMAQNSWYRLTDDGKGFLVPAEEGTGTGTINYETGSVVLTCAALPDVDSRIIWYWGAALDEENIPDAIDSGDVGGLSPLEVQFQVDNPPISPASLVVNWEDGEGLPQVLQDIDGEGVLSGDGEASVDYSSGILTVIPYEMPPDKTFSCDYDTANDTPYSGEVLDLVSNTVINPPVTPRSLKGTIKQVYDVYSAECDFQTNAAGQLLVTTARISINPDKRKVDADQAYYSTPKISVTPGEVLGTIDYPTGVITWAAGPITGAVQYKIHTPILAYDYTGGRLSWRVSSWHVVQTSGTAVFTAGGDETVISYIGASIGTTDEHTGEEHVISDLKFNSCPVNVQAVTPGSVRFEYDGHQFRDRQGVLYMDISPVTNTGTAVGTVDYETGTIFFNSSFSVMGLNTVTLSGLLYSLKRQSLCSVTWRTPGAPLRPGSLSVQATRADTDVVISATAGVDGTISTDFMAGEVDAERGVVDLSFGEWVTAEGNEGKPWYDPELVEGGEIFKPIPVYADSITYNCVVYNYLPLDADLIGLDPVRLPQDGRVPVFRKGDIAVIHHTLVDTLSGSVTAGQVVELSRGDLSWVDLHDANGLWVPSAGLYTVDLAAGTVTFTDPLPDLSDYTQPFQIRHRREDMVLLGDVQINGTLSAIAPLTHDYPADETLISTVLPVGDLQSGVDNEFTQQTWTSEWSDERIGSGTTAQYNLTQYPIQVTNKGAIQERWAIIFTASDAFQIAGESTGIIATGYTSQDMAPVNPATGVPYFEIAHEGWGTGWASGNVLRFNTRAAHYPVWFVRTTLQGPETEAEDSFTLQIRGDAN